MPAININYLLKSKRERTIPFVRVPKNVKESLNIDKIHPNGIFKLDGRW